jgi:hypothetical protein
VSAALAETWNERSEHGYGHEGSTVIQPSPMEVLDRMMVGKRAAFWLRWEPKSLRDFLEDMDFGEDDDWREDFG